MPILDAWFRDIPQQFLGKEKIEALIKAFARQLQEVEAVFSDLDNLTDLETATGRNLDNIGTIIPLTRKEAGMLAGANNPEYVISDERYRQYLKYQLLVNTSEGTYYDILTAARMFWDGPLRYTEPPGEPASYHLDAYVTDFAHKPDDFLRVPAIRSAGVGVGITVHLPEINDEIYAGGRLAATTKTALPIIPDEFHYRSTLRIGGKAAQTTRTVLPPIADHLRFENVVHTGGKGGRTVSRAVPILADSLRFESHLRSGGALTARPFWAVPLILDTLVPKGGVRAGGRLSVVSNLSVPLAAIDIWYPYTLERRDSLGGKLALVTSRAIPSVPDVFLRSQTVRSGGRMAFMRSTPVPIAPNIIVFPHEIRRNERAGGRTGFVSRFGIPTIPDDYRFQAVGGLGVVAETVSGIAVPLMPDTLKMVSSQQVGISAEQISVFPVPIAPKIIIFPYEMERKDGVGGRLSVSVERSIPPVPDSLDFRRVLRSAVLGAGITQVSMSDFADELAFKSALGTGGWIELAGITPVPIAPETHILPQMERQYDAGILPERIGEIHIPAAVDVFRPIETVRAGGLLERIAEIPVRVLDDQINMETMEENLHAGFLVETQTGLVIPQMSAHTDRSDGQPERAVSIPIPEIK